MIPEVWDESPADAALSTLHGTLRPVPAGIGDGLLGHRITPKVTLNDGPCTANLLAMKKRIVAAILWFNAAWFMGAALAFAMGLSPALAPILAIAAAAIIAVDPRHLIWTGRRAISNGTAMLPSTQTLHTA